MAPKKEKAEKASANAQEDMVLKYLKQQNRPYSATDVSANLHNKVTKSAAQKILVKLHEAKKIEGRISGKQSVYHTIQDPSLAPTPEQLAAMDARTQELHDETASLAMHAKTLRTQLTQLTSSLSTADLRVQIAAMQKETAEVESRLAELRSGSVRPVSREEKGRVDKELRVVGRCRERRARIVKEMWGVIKEAVPREEWEDLREDFGVEV